MKTHTHTLFQIGTFSLTSSLSPTSKVEIIESNSQLEIRKVIENNHKTIQDNSVRLNR
jgi:hypothetical protein